MSTLGTRPRTAPRVDVDGRPTSSRSTVARIIAFVGALLGAVCASTPAVAAAPLLAQASTPEVVVEVFAKGGTGAERLEVRVENRTVASFTLTTTLREYRYRTTRAIDSTALSLHFVNDAPVTRGDRSVTVDRIVVNEHQFQTEDPSVVALGAWRNGSCKRAGNHRAQSLTCNGWFRYTIGAAGTPRAPRSPAPPRPSTPFPAAGSNGQVGCVQQCRTVGFQDFDGKANHVVENLIISNPGGPCLSLVGARNITIRNVTLRNCSTAVDGSFAQKKIVKIANSSNITITGTLFADNASRSITNHDLIAVSNSQDVRIVNNVIQNVASATNADGPDSGNRAILVTGNRTRNLTIDRNTMLSPGRNAVQISRARRVEGVRITRNRIEGRGPWDSDFEDMINFFSTTGTPASPILVRKNYLRNGGPSPSGTAIILGDGRNRLGTGNVRVVENVIVDPGHVGINIVSGFNFTVKNNIVFGGANVGEWTATGLVVHHQRYTPACRDHAVFGNRVYFRNQFPQHNGTNHTWIPGTCTNNVRVHSNAFGDRTLSYRVWNLD